MRPRLGALRKRGKPLRYAGTFVVFALAAAVIASAQAAPSTKKYEAYVVAANPASTSFTVTLTNNTRSQQTLGSANFTAPSGFTLGSVASSTVTSTDGHTWNVCIGNGMVCGSGNVVQLRAASNGDALAPGASVSATISVTGFGACSTATWSTAAKQSNDFSGTNNDFALVAADVTPLGSLAWATIGTQTTATQFTASVTAKDTCGNLKSDYGGGPVPPPYTGDTLDHVGLTGATISGLSWSGGIGSVKITPAQAEIPNNLTVTDNLTGISATSNDFDVVDILCDGTKPCSAKDNPGTTLAGAPDPPPGATLGLGFNKLYHLSGVACGGLTPIGSFVIIDPSGYDGSSFHQVTLTYKKAISGSNPASGFVVCYSKNDGTDWTAAPNCVSDTTGPAPCVISRKRVSGGDLQVVLLIGGDDPPVGGGFG